MLGCAVVGALSLPARPARAEPPGAAPLPGLVVRRGEGASSCPDAPALAAAVAAQMGHPALDPAAPAWRPSIEVRVDRAPGGFSATVFQAGRERHLDDPGPACAALADALAVTIAILLDPDANPALPPARAAAPPPAQPPALPAAPPERPPPRLALGVEGLFTYGLLGAAARPAIAPLLEIRVAGPIWIAPALLVAPARSIDFPPGTVDVSLTAGSLRLCGTVLGAVDGPSLSACLEPGLGALRGSGHGYASDDAGTRLWASLGVGLVARGPIVRPFGWFAHASGFALLGHPEQFDVRGVPGIAYDPTPVGLGVGAGLRLSIF